MKQEEMIAQTRNGGMGSIQNSHSAKNIEFDAMSGRGGVRGQSQVIKAKAFRANKISIGRDALTDGEDFYGDDPIGEDFSGAATPASGTPADLRNRLAQIKRNA